ncbi:MAG TPA: ImmA/IrrE family metallo-endopeptidase [Nostocaceae cyanobacterium]|nr:ImmA/IrrE family metallo-endopeptidase [Nostocaceae cyanobacterium]
MNKILEMPTLYNRLSTVGFPKNFIQEKALPEWWNSELEKNPVAVMEAAGYISKRLGLDVASVLNPEVPIEFKKVNHPKFKKRQNTDEQRLLIAQGLATRIAEMISYAAKSPFTGVPSDPSEIRSIILKNHDWVDLENLVNFCWSYGIPVAHFSNFPPKTIKMDGIAAYLNDRPAIVISSGWRYSAYLVFILAHELGHIACGHVQDGLLLDESIKDEIQDKEEVEANNFAVNLLLGKEYNWEKMPNPIELRRAVGKIGREDRVDPGVLALNYALKMSDWSTGNGALKIIERQANAPTKINQFLSDNLDWEELDKDSEEYLRLVTGM